MLNAAEHEPFAPGPMEAPEEQIARFNEDPYSYLEALEKEYGTIFNLQLGSLGNDADVGIETNGSWVFLSRPHQIKSMYNTDGDAVSGALANKVFFGTREKSVAYIDGTAHRCRRSQLHPSFSGIRDYVSIIADVARRCMASWPREKTFKLFPELQKLTAEVIVEVVCGNLEKSDRMHLCAMMPRTEGAQYTRQELRQAETSIRAYIHDRINGYLARSGTAGRDDVFTTLLRLGAEGDTSLSDEVVRDEVFSLLYTGFSTTANTLSWAFIRILSNPEVYRKLIQELDENFQQEPLGWESLRALTYLDATIKETLRLHPVTPLNGVRLVKRPLRIDEYLIPAGTILVHCAYLLQRSADVYEDPENFQPERFLDKTFDQYTWGAFGGGSRTCIGRSFSKEEMKLVLAIALSTLRIELAGEIPRAKQQGFFMAPEDGAPCVIR